MAKILDGRVVRDKIAEKLKAEISRRSLKPKLVITQIGDLPQSNTYIRQKVLFGQKIGALVDHQRFDANISGKELISQLSIPNSQLGVHGIIVQMPLPKHLDKNKIVDTIDPVKDVDGQTNTNIKLLFESSSLHHSTSPLRHSEPFGHSERSEESQGKLREESRSFDIKSQDDTEMVSRGYLPATTKGILTLLDHYQIPVSGKHVVIVGRSSLVGKPTALALINHDATVTICHSKTSHLSLITRHCDILIVAAGKPKLITKDYVSRNQVVIDVGINILEKSRGLTPAGVEPQLSKPEAEPEKRKLVGDVDFENVSQVVKAISPVPGGCGPLTVASLFENLLIAYRRQLS